MAKYSLRIAVLYALLGISIGIFMGVSEDFLNRPIHAHANLVGWVSLALMGLSYRVYPELGNSRLALVQFVLHNIGLPLQLASLYGLVREMDFGKPMVAVGSIAVAAAFVTFAINVWVNLKD